MATKARTRVRQQLTPPPGGAVIRMYRQGLGDCFLLAFSGSKPDRPSYVLIDCGVHFAQTAGRATMKQIVDDIVRATGGRLNVVVATHEHTDHLSGFNHEANRFLNDLTIDHVWLAWTEDQNEPLAKQLKGNRGATKKAIAKALERLKNQAGGQRAALAAAERLDHVMSFEADEDGPEERQARAGLAARLGLAAADDVTGNEIAYAVLRVRAKSVTHLRPGAGPERIPGADGARAYVLGPPLDEPLLRKSDPSSGSGRETYLATSAANLALSPQVHDRLPEDAIAADREELCFPFDQRYRSNLEQAFFTQHYVHAEQWRKIDLDWLYAFEGLSLQLAKHTNNTSLVLAFELGEPGRGPILLFAADAQVGNWLSWGDHTWSVSNREVRIADLLQRTVVYKVGHHASHNATLRKDVHGCPYGLEIIPEGVVALIPVDQASAEKLDWGMPYSELYEVLKTKSRGNLLRSDDGHDPSLPTLRTKLTRVPRAPHARWRHSFATKEVDGKPLYYDLEITPTS